MLSAFVRRSMAPITVACTIAALAACSDSVAPPDSRATPTVLRASVAVAPAVVHVLPGLDGAHPRSINEFEEVVGSTASGQPFYYSASRGVILLAHSGFATGEVESINDKGTMAGTAGGNTAAVWMPLPAGTFKPLQKPASQTCAANGVTFDGEIIGTCAGGGASFGTEFSWDGLPTEAAGYQYNAISDDRYIGGAGNNGSRTTGPIVIAPSGQVTALLGGDGQTHIYSAVNAVAVHGYLAGYSTEGQCTQAITWGLFTSSRPPWPARLLGICGQAHGITPDGYVVGTSGTNWAFLWYINPGPGLEALPGLGGSNETSTAVAISLHEALGTITSSGVTHTVIWDLPNRS